MKNGGSFLNDSIVLTLPEANKLGSTMQKARRILAAELDKLPIGKSSDNKATLLNSIINELDTQINEIIRASTAIVEKSEEFSKMENGG